MLNIKFDQDCPTHFRILWRLKFKKIIGTCRADFSDQFRKIICYKHIGYNINIMPQSACLVFKPITLMTLLPSLIARQWVGLQTQWWPLHKVIYFGWGRSFFVCCLAHRGWTVGFLLLQCFSGVVRHPRNLQVLVAICCFCPVLIFVSLYYPKVLTGHLVFIILSQSY